MNLKTRALSIAGAAIMALSMVPGAVALEETTDTADVTVAVSAPSGGALRWTIGGGAPFTAVTGSLDDQGTSEGGLVLSVEDTRFTRSGWSLSISATDFEGETTGDIIPATNFSIATGDLQVQAGDSNTNAIPESLSLGTGAQVILSAPVGSGSGRYALPLDASVTIPANTAADRYVSTITVDETTAP